VVESPCPFDSCCATIPCMPSFTGRSLSIVSILLITLLFCVGSASAQSGFTAVLTPPNTSNFPHLSTYLDVHDPSGGFVHALTPQDVSIQEDGVSLPVTEMVEQTPGVQFVIAITPGASFNIRDTMGTSRFEYLLQGMLAGRWASQPAGVDDFSLLTMGGPQLTHTSSPSSLLTELETYTQTETNTVPNLEVLAAGLQVASDPTPRPGMERAILFITPPQETDVSLGLQSIISSASQQNIHIYVWLVAAPEVFTSPGVDPLRSLADQTHGAFFAFSHDEAVPDLETILEPLRYVYQLRYESQVASPGAHQVIAQVTTASGLVISPPQPFTLDLQAPVPTLLNPPDKIVRTYASQPTPGNAPVSTVLEPLEQVLNIQVAFPDGYNHSLTLIRLYVDGAVAAENAQPPFNRLVWDLRPYTQDGVHTLVVEATDNLGLVGKTAETSVSISVPSPVQGMFIAVANKKPLLLGAVAVVSTSVLVLVLILGGRIRPRLHPGQVRNGVNRTEKTRRVGYQQVLHQPKDPVIHPPENTAPAMPMREPLHSKGWFERLPWVRHEEVLAPARAYLIPLVGFDEPTIPIPLQITADDISLGSDPHLANLVITDPSIERLHARIHLDGKLFLLIDAGTVAGTWVNYEQVASTGTHLRHMDIIHLGRIGFRFQLSEPGPLRKVIVSPLELRQ
jgi:hypothetical protein